MIDDLTIIPLSPVDKAKQLSEIWSNAMLTIGKNYAAAWKAGTLNHVNLGLLKSVRDIAVLSYHEAVRLGILDPIEALGKEEKDALKSLANEHGKNLSVKERINYCKSLWLIVNL
jgi:hypothetical protein